MSSQPGLVNYTKPQADAAFQAIENWLEANRGSISDAINAATTPRGITFTPAQKRQMLRQYFKQKFRRDGGA